MQSVTQLPQDNWIKDFNDTYVDSIDKSIIQHILSGLRWGSNYEAECTINRMMHIIEDKGKWVYRNRRTRYKRLRKVADFLGVPPWLILQSEHNVLLRTLFESRGSKYDNYPLRDFVSEIDQAVIGLNGYKLTSDVRNRFKAELQNLVSEFQKITGGIDNRDEGHPNSFSNLCKKISSFRGPYSFIVSVPIPIDSGATIPVNVRFIQGLLPEFSNMVNLKREHTWRAAWISVNLSTSEFNKYYRNIHSVVERVSELFDVEGTKFSPSEGESMPIVYSWHSLKKRVLNPGVVIEIGNKLPRIPLTMNHDIYNPFLISASLPSLTLESEKSFYKDLLRFCKWINFDIPKSQRQSLVQLEQYLKIFTANEFVRPSGQMRLFKSWGPISNVLT